MQILKAGGILMYFILLMGIIGLYAILERFSYFLIKERNNFSKLPSDVRQLINEGKIKEAIVALNSNKSSTSLVLKEILIYGYKENKETLSALEEKGKEKAIEQIKSLERNMWLLSLAANASPLLGLLGTVTGMITAFNSIALNGTGDAGVLAKGISEALYTTAGGLIVAIPCMIFYNYFNKKIDLIVSDIEKTCTSFNVLFVFAAVDLGKSILKADLSSKLVANIKKISRRKTTSISGVISRTNVPPLLLFILSNFIYSHLLSEMVQQLCTSLFYITHY